MIELFRTLKCCGQELNLSPKDRRNRVFIFGLGFEKCCINSQRKKQTTWLEHICRKIPLQSISKASLFDTINRSTNDDIVLDIEEITIHTKEADDTIVMDNLTGSRGTSRSSNAPQRCRMSIDRRTFHLAASIVSQVEEKGDNPKPG